MKSAQFVFKQLVIGIFFLLLTGCGFHLRTKSDLPPQLWRLYVKSAAPYSAFSTKLRQMLLSLGVVLVDTQQDAPITLNIVSTHFNYSIPSISTSNQAQSYNYSYVVSFNLMTQKGKIVLPTQSVTASGNIILQPNEALGSTAQASVLEDQLQDTCVNMLYEILTAEQTYEDLSKSTSTSTKKSARTRLSH